MSMTSQCVRKMAMAGTALLVGLSGLLAAPAMAQEKVEVRLGLTTPDDSINGVVGHMWDKLAQTLSNGRVTVKVFPSGQLGKERAQLEGLVTGSHDAFEHISAYTGKYPELRFWDLPFLFQNTDQVTRLAYSGMQQDLEKVFDKEGMVYLATVGYGYRQFSVRNKAYNSPADLVGQKHRIPGGKSKMMLFEALGANVSTVSFPELYQALAQGVVDSQDNPIQIIHSAKFHEVTNYLSLLNYVYNPNIIAAGKPFWDKLDKDAQKVLKESAYLVQGWSIQAAERFDAEYLTKIKDEKPSIKVNTLDPATLPQWKEKAKSVYAAFEEETSKAFADNIYQTVEGGFYKPQVK